MDRFSQYGRIATEVVFPVRVTENDLSPPLLPIIVRTQRSPKQGLNAKYVEEARRCVETRNALNRVGANDVERRDRSSPIGQRPHRIKDAALRLPVDEVRRAHSLAIHTSIRVALPDSHESIGFGER